MNHGSPEETIKTSGGRVDLKSNSITAVIVLILMTVITGVIYPLAITGIAKLVFPVQANGSIVYEQGEAVGSGLIGQTFEDDKYFHGRPSAAGDGYDAAASSGSNLGPTNKALLDEIAKRTGEVRSKNGLPENAKVPSDIVTASGSGLDPDISLESAYLQIARIAETRGISDDKVRAIVDNSVKDRTFGILGEKRVNVLELNMDLDRASK